MTRNASRSVLLSALVLLLLAGSAQGHVLSQSKVRSSLKPVAKELADSVGQAIASTTPGATVVQSGVGACRRKTSHRVDCNLTFTVRSPEAGDLTCSLPARVKYRNARSRELVVSVGAALTCSFKISLQ